MAYLDNISSFNKDLLKPTTTTLTQRNGIQYIEYKDEDGNSCLKEVGNVPLPSYLTEQRKGRKACGPFEFVDGRWSQKQNLQPVNIEVDKLSFITYNVWFASFHFEERAVALFNILREREPDFISLQEVTPRLVELIKEQRWIQEKYMLSDATGNTVTPYGVLMLTKLPIYSWTLHDLPTNMGRRVLIAELLIHGQTTRVATVHLESMNNPKYRRAQLNLIYPALEEHGCQHSFLMGDFNFCAESTENVTNIHSEYIDIWPSLHQTSAVINRSDGYISPAEMDGEIQLTDSDEEEEEYAFPASDHLPGYTRGNKRLDRILCRSSSKLFVPFAMELLGTEPFDDSHPDLRPSDHYGLFAVVRIDPLAVSASCEGDVSSSASGESSGTSSQNDD